MTKSTALAPAAILARRFEEFFESGDVPGALAVQSELWRAAEPLESTRPRDLPLLGWSRMAPADHDRFLFVSGTPRSGTSALGQLLKSHADIAVYNELYPDRYGYLPAMFAPENVGELHRRGPLLGQVPRLPPDVTAYVEDHHDAGLDAAVRTMAMA